MQEQRGTPLTRAESASPSTARRRATLVWVVLAASVLIDQGTKWWALRDLEPGVTHPLILLSLRLIRNPGAAFSMLDGMTYVVTAIAVGIVIRILHLAHTRLLSRGYAWILGLVAGERSATCWIASCASRASGAATWSTSSTTAACSWGMSPTS